MDQDANERKTFLIRANQLLRATTHPALVQLPIEGTLPSLGGATGWLNSPPLTADGLSCPDMNDKVFDAIRTFRARYIDKGPETVP